MPDFVEEVEPEDVGLAIALGESDDGAFRSLPPGDATDAGAGEPP